MHSPCECDPPTARRWRTAAAAAIIVVAVMLLFTRLGQPYLWTDEAETALLGRTTLTYGIPRVLEGANLVSQNIGRDHDASFIWRWSPWLQFYLVAPFVALFGVSNAALRFPFALLGLATVLLSRPMLRAHLKDETFALAGMAALATCVPFALLARQVRYYSPSMFLAVAALWAYARVLDRRRGGGALLFGALALTFQANFFFFAVLAGAFAVDVLMWRRHARAPVLGSTALALAASTPWIVFAWGTPYDAATAARAGLGPFAARALEFGTHFASQLGVQVFSPGLIAVSGVVALVIWRRRTGIMPPETLPGVRLFALLVVAAILAAAAAAPAPSMRYVAIALPPLLALAGLLVVAAFRIQVIAGFLALAIFASTSSLPSYAYELTHDFHGPIAGIVTYLRANAHPNQTVAITYGDLPLKLYLPHLRIVGGLAGDDLQPAADADFIIIRKYVLCDWDAAVREFLENRIATGSYERIEIDAPDTPFENREEPAEHLFRTATAEDRVAIWRRIR